MRVSANRSQSDLGPSAAVRLTVRNRHILLADLALIAIAAWGAYALRFDWLFGLYREEFPIFLAAALLIKPITFHAFGLYRRYWHYASLWDLVAVVFAASSASIVIALVMAALRLFDLIPGFPRTVIPIDWLATMTLTGGLRMSVRLLVELKKQDVDRTAAGIKKVLVVGAGDAGVIVVREMQRNPQLQMLPVGFLDDDATKQGKIILGVRVLGPLGALAAAARESRADEVVIALPTAPGPVVRSVVKQCRETSLPSRAIPGIFEMLDRPVDVSRLRQVEISDLLRRAPVATGDRRRSHLENRTVLVTGAGGSIGAELCRQIARDNPRLLVMVGHGENSVFEIEQQLAVAFPQVKVASVIADVRNQERIEQVFRKFRPDVVLHAAAHKHVPLMEGNPEEAITNNVIGTRNVVDAAVRFQVDRLVMISTDKAVAPMSVMGASKRLAEMIVRRTARQQRRQFAVVRFGNVLGSRGSVVPLFKAQLERGGPLTITHPDMRRFFMTIPEAVHLVLEASGVAMEGDLLVLNMGEPVRIVDLAGDLMELSGFSRGEIEICYTGLRHGEKLEESLWEEGAVVTPTQTTDVLRVLEPDDTLGSDLDAAVGELERAAQRGDTLTIQAILADVIPTFGPVPERF
jgi:FlaA1/EpsC-like NDP-sugar epimerase